MPPDYISTPDAAARHHVSRAYVRRLAQRGLIPGAAKIGGSWLIPATWTPPPRQKPGPRPGWKQARSSRAD